MARNVTIKFLRATRANLNTQRSGSALVVGEPYLITDEGRFAIATAVNVYSEFMLRTGDTLTGRLNTVATDTGGAGLNIPHGTAPSSPTNGDLWTTTGGLYARINGATQGPYLASISNGSISLAMMANLAPNTIIGRITGSTGVPEALSAANVRTIINVADGATANDTDANLKARANHTGTQAASTISDFSEAVDDRVSALLVEGTGIDITYNDGSNTLTIATATTPIQKYTATIGDGAATSFNIDHNLNTRNVVVEVYTNSGNYDTIIADITRTTVNRVVVTFASAPASNAYNVVVMG